MPNIDDGFNAPIRVEVELTKEDMLGALRWGEKSEVKTKYGPRLVQSARATIKFVDYYDMHESELRAEGYTLGEYNGSRRVTKWEKVPQKVIIERQRSGELSRATDAKIDIPRPEGMEFFGYQKAGVAFALNVLGELE